MSSAEHPAGGGFRRQVTFRVGAEDAALLEAAARAHGGIQAGIVAALRAYATQRLQATIPAEFRAEERTAVPSPPEPLAPHP